MKLLLDNQLPIVLARFLTARGWDCVHVHDIQLEAAPDRVIWEYAIKNALVIVTKDADFAQRSDLQGTAPPQIVWVRLGNLRRKALIAEFSRLMPDIERAIANGIRITQLP